MDPLGVGRAAYRQRASRCDNRGMVQARVLRPDGDLRCVLTALSLLALLATFALPVFGPGLAAYAPEHGHVTLAGYVPPNHVHPWDSEAGAAPADSAAHEGEAEIAFTLATDGEAASGWASATLVPAPLAVALAGLVLAADGSAESAPDAPQEAAPSPPPRI